MLAVGHLCQNTSVLIFCTIYVCARAELMEFVMFMVWLKRAEDMGRSPSLCIGLAEAYSRFIGPARGCGSDDE